MKEKMYNLALNSFEKNAKKLPTVVIMDMYAILKKIWEKRLSDFSENLNRELNEIRRN